MYQGTSKVSCLAGPIGWLTSKLSRLAVDPVDAELVVEIHGEFPWYFLGRNERPDIADVDGPDVGIEAWVDGVVYSEERKKLLLDSHTAHSAGFTYLIEGDDELIVHDRMFVRHIDLSKRYSVPDLGGPHADALEFDLWNDGSIEGSMTKDYRVSTHPWRRGVNTVMSYSAVMYAASCVAIASRGQLFSVKRNFIAVMLGFTNLQGNPHSTGFIDEEAIQFWKDVDRANEEVLEMFQSIGFDPIVHGQRILNCSGACARVERLFAQPEDIGFALPPRMHRFEQSTMSCELHPDEEQVLKHEMNFRTHLHVTNTNGDIDCDVTIHTLDNGFLRSQAYNSKQRALYYNLLHFAHPLVYLVIPSDIGTTIFHVHFRLAWVDHHHRNIWVPVYESVLVLSHQGNEEALAANHNKLMHILHGNTHPHVGGLKLRDRPGERKNGKGRPLCVEALCTRVAHYFDPDAPVVTNLTKRCHMHKLDTDDSDQPYKVRCIETGCGRLAAFAKIGGNREHCYRHKVDGELNERDICAAKKAQAAREARGWIEQSIRSDSEDEPIDLNAESPVGLDVLATAIDFDTNEEEETKHEINVSPHLVSALGPDFGVKRGGSTVFTVEPTKPATLLAVKPKEDGVSWEAMWKTDNAVFQSFKRSSLYEISQTTQKALLQSKVLDGGFPYAMIPPRVYLNANKFGCLGCDFKRMSRYVFNVRDKTVREAVQRDARLMSMNRTDLDLSVDQRLCAAYGCHPAMFKDLLTTKSQAVITGFIITFVLGEDGPTQLIYPLMGFDWRGVVGKLHPESMNVASTEGPCLIFAASVRGAAVFHGHIVVVPGRKLIDRSQIQLPLLSVFPVAVFCDDSTFANLNDRVLKMTHVS